MADVAIVNSSVTATPEDYTVPGTQEIILKSVRAAIDGTGAAGSFLPALQLLDPAGHVMWTAVDTSSPVAAGGSADVSWFPGLGGGGGVSAALPQWCYVNRVGNQSMGAGITDTIVWTSLKSSDSSLFSLGTDNHPNDAVQVARQGVLVVSVYMTLDPAGTDFSAGLRTNLVGFGVLGESTYTPDKQFNRAGLPGGTNRFGPRDISVMVMSQVPQQVVALYTNFDAANRNLTGAQMGLLWWPNLTAVT